jgi:hypothetical protein
MGKYVSLLAAGLFAIMFNPVVFAEEEADAWIRICEQQNQDAADQYAAVMKCLDEQAQYATSE